MTETFSDEAMENMLDLYREREKQINVPAEIR